jgi:hypothetical protein
MDDSTPVMNDFGRKSHGDTELMEYNRKLKQLQERVLLREYHAKLDKNIIGRQQDQLNKQQ